MDYKVIVSDAKYFNYPFIKVLKKHKCKEKEPIIVSKSIEGKYSVNFKNLVGWKFFNKVKTSIYLKKSKFYPKTIIIDNKKEFKNCTLKRGKKYFVKPKFGDKSQNIVFINGRKEVLVGDLNELQYPVIVQEQIKGTMQDGHKIDFRIYVLYIKNENEIKAFYYKKGIKRFSKKSTLEEDIDNIFTNQVDKTGIRMDVIPIEENIEECLRDVNSKIIKRMNKENISELEFFLTGFDVIMDGEGKYWVMEVNSAPNLLYSSYPEVKLLVNSMLEEIYNIIVKYDETKTIYIENFKDL